MIQPKKMPKPIKAPPMPDRRPTRLEMWQQNHRQAAEIKRLVGELKHARAENKQWIFQAPPPMQDGPDQLVLEKLDKLEMRIDRANADDEADMSSLIVGVLVIVLIALLAVNIVSAI